ncbi:hypothetical protein LXL04_011709 [Taraxacum kok-saghyz]
MDPFDSSSEDDDFITNVFYSYDFDDLETIIFNAAHDSDGEDVEAGDVLIDGDDVEADDDYDDVVDNSEDDEGRHIHENRIPIFPVFGLNKEIDRLINGRLGTGGDSGGALCVVIAGTVVADTGEEQSGGVRQYANKWTIDTRSHCDLFWSCYDFSYRHRCSHLCRMFDGNHKASIFSFISGCPIPIPLPFPLIFGNHVGRRGEISSQPESESGSGDVESVPMAARLRSSTAVLPYLENRLGNIRKFGLERGAIGAEVLGSWGFGSFGREEVEEIGENLSKLVLALDPQQDCSSDSD